MCGRFTNTLKREDLAHVFPEAAAVSDDGVFERFNVAPTQDVLAVIAKDGVRRMGPLRWGLVPFWAKDPKIGAKMVNARAETLGEKPAFRDLVERSRSRCLILADGYYEWLKPEDPKAPRIPMRFTLSDGRPFAFAGLWTWWRPRDGGKEDRLATCTIVTTRANRIAAPIHDRMPVVLAEEGQRAAWLDDELDGAAVTPLLAPLPDDADLVVAPANPCVNSHLNDGPECLTP